MGDVPLGVIEIVLGFGALIAWALWELRRNRRALDQMRRDAGGSPGDRGGPRR